MKINFLEISKWSTQLDGLLEGENDFATISEKILEKIARGLCCQWAVYWKVDDENHLLIPYSKWSEMTSKASDLDRHTTTRKLSLNEGAAGQVWRKKKTLWTLDLNLDMCLPRSLDATSSGLNGGIWFPVMYASKVVGIVELLGTDIEMPTEGLMSALESFGAVFGYKIKINGYA